MRAVRASCALFLLCWFTSYLTAQARPLDEISATRIQPDPPDFIAAEKCQGDGNVYLVTRNEARSGSIVEIQKNGQLQSKIALDNIPEIKPAGSWVIEDFALVGTTIYVLGNYSPPKAKDAETLTPKYAIFEFGSDGQFERQIELSEPMIPLRLAAFQTTGDLLVMGKYIKGPLFATTLAGRTRTAIFNSSGKLIREVKFAPEDLAKGAKLGEEDVDGSYELNLSRMEPADDGYIYIALTGHSQRPTVKQALVAVISPSGRVARILRLAGPKDGELLRIAVGGGYIAAVFGVRSANEPRAFATVVVSVFNSFTGEKLGDYSGAGNIVCFDGSTLTAIGVKEDGYFYLFHLGL